MSVNETKLELFGLLAADPDLDLRRFVQKFGVPLNTLKRWQKEHLSNLSEADLDVVLHADEIIVERVAAEVIKEVAAVTQLEHLEIDPETDDIIPASELIKRQEEAVAKQVELEKKKVDLFKGKVAGLKGLQEESQAVASNLMLAIAEKTQFADTLSTKDIQSLSSALTSIQNAFFNKPTTSISVNTQTNVGENPISDFRLRLKA